MNRPKSASSSTSFLDDLLGNEIENAVLTSSTSSPATSATRQRKSVRFFDDDDDDDQPELSSLRPHNSTLDSLLNTSNGKSQDKSKTDWLGISSSEEEAAPAPATSMPSTRQTSSAFASIIAPRGGSAGATATSKTAASSDWLSAGLRARQAQATTTTTTTAAQQQQQSKEPQPPPTTTIEPRPWQPKLLSQSEGARAANVVGTIAAAPATPTTLEQPPTPKAAISSGEKETHVEINLPNAVGDAQKVVAPIDETKDNVDKTSVAYLQTQLRMVTLEKTFLEGTVDQLKSNHRDEVQAMVSLYEQQMRLTSEMYKRQEAMIQEEHDHRAAELKTHLRHLETEMGAMKDKYQQRLAHLESEWRADLARTRESHSAVLAELNEQHQQDIARLEQRAQFETDEALQNSNELVKRQSRTIGEMLVKWEESARKIESLQKTVIARQEELARERAQAPPEEQQIDRIALEDQWQAFLEQLQQQRTQFETILERERDKMDAQAGQKLDEARQELEKERAELTQMKANFVREVNEWRDRQATDAVKSLRDREKLKEDVFAFEQRRTMLETLGNERKVLLEQEQARLASASEELDRRKLDLDRQQADLLATMFNIKQAEQQIQLGRDQFEEEKEHLQQLGETLFSRAEELEKLSEMTLKEKMEGMQTMDEIDAFRAEINTKMDMIEQATKELRAEQSHLTIQRAQMEQQWQMIKELRDSIVCNLCGNAISQAKFWPTKCALARHEAAVEESSAFPPPAVFYSLVNGFRKNARQSSAAAATTTDDNNLLHWQVASQKDAARLAEETKFLDGLRERRN